MARAAEIVIELAHYRELFSSDGYPPGLRPFGGRAGTTVAGLTRTRNGENSTLVVPDDLLRAVPAAALYMVRTRARGLVTTAGSAGLPGGRPANPGENTVTLTTPASRP